MAEQGTSYPWTIGRGVFQGGGIQGGGIIFQGGGIIFLLTFL